MLEKIEYKMNEFISSLNDENINELFKTLPQGKRLRSKLVLNIAEQTDEAINLCAIIELIHLASLLHDDVIDDSLVRRGKESFNAKYGDKNAIMLGDILYSKAFYELSSLPKEVAKVVSNSVTQLSIGEMLDVKLSSKFNENKSLYMDMIYKKTASLIEASAVCGAILAKKDEEKFGIYGKNLGLAFQIIDDILDITQDSKTLGKPSLHDFKEGKTTLPYLYMYEKLNTQDREKLLSYFKKELNENESAWIKNKMNETNAVKKAIKEAKGLGNEALKSIENENIPKLHEVVKSMIDREF